MNLSPFGSTRVSGKMAMVGLPAMRRGSFVLVTRPSTVAPMGITVFPSITTGSVTLAENGSPAFELKVASVVSSFILTAVPVGRAVCAQAKLPITRSDANESFFHVESYLQNSLPKSGQKSVADLRKALITSSSGARSSWWLATVDIPHPSAAIDDERGRARDVDGVAAEARDGRRRLWSRCDPHRAKRRFRSDASPGSFPASRRHCAFRRR
jgi:hypothetical protein